MEQSAIMQMLGSKDVIKVHVNPASKSNEIVKYENGVLYVNINAPPEKGKANLELCKFLKKLTKRQARVKAGESSKDKVIVFL